MKYSEAEKSIAWTVLCRINGNFDIGHDARNGNVYFCEEGITFISLDKKPFSAESLSADNIWKMEVDGACLKIYSNDGRLYKAVVPDIAWLSETLKDKGLIQYGWIR